MPEAPRTLSNSVPILLIPPSEGKATGGRGRPWDPAAGSFGTLAAERAAVARALVGVDGGSERLLGARGERLDAARAANRALLGAPTLPAWRRYRGVVWEHLDPDTLDPALRRRILVPSGLAGLVRGDDPLPEYRLKMGARLPPLGHLAAWWRPAVSAAIDRRSRGRFVVDLLPREHRAAWLPGPSVEGVRVELVERSGRPGGHFAKAAKGRLARELLLRGPEALDDWRDERFELAVTPLGDERSG